MHELSITQGPVGAVPDTTGERPATALNVGIALFPFHGCGGADVGVPGQNTDSSPRRCHRTLAYNVRLRR